MTSTSEQFLKSKGIVELCKVDFGYSFDLMQLQSVSWYFETFRCFTKFSFYHKWNDVRLLLINMVYTSFPTTQDLRNEEISIPWAIAAAASTQQAATRIKHSPAKSKKAEARHHRASPQGRQEPPTNHEKPAIPPEYANKEPKDEVESLHEMNIKVVHRLILPSPLAAPRHAHSSIILICKERSG